MKRGSKKKKAGRPPRLQKPTATEKLAIIDLAKAGKGAGAIQGLYPLVRQGSISAMLAHHGPNGRNGNGHPKLGAEVEVTPATPPQSMAEMRDRILVEMEAEIQVTVSAAVRTITERFRKKLS